MPLVTLQRFSYISVSKLWNLWCEEKSKECPQCGGKCKKNYCFFTLWPNPESNRNRVEKIAKILGSLGSGILVNILARKRLMSLSSDPTNSGWLVEYTRNVFASLSRHWAIAFGHFYFEFYVIYNVNAHYRPLESWCQRAASPSMVLHVRLDQHYHRTRPHIASWRRLDDDDNSTAFKLVRNLHRPGCCIKFIERRGEPA